MIQSKPIQGHRQYLKAIAIGLAGATTGCFENLYSSEVSDGKGGESPSPPGETMTPSPTPTATLTPTSPSAPTPNPEPASPKLTATDGDENDFFGVSVAADDDTVVVGAPGDEHPNGDKAGAAYVFDQTGRAGVSKPNSPWTTATRMTSSAGRWHWTVRPH